jgi:hypothetical protein
VADDEHGSAARDWDAALGSVAEETARLLQALGGADGSAAGGAPGTEPSGVASDHQHVPMGSAQSCTWCPVCRGITLVRELSPDTLRSLADVATLAASTLADLAVRRGADAHADPGPEDADRAGHAHERPSGGARPRRPRTVVEEVPVVRRPASYHPHGGPDGHTDATLEATTQTIASGGAL